jgi:predicted nucleic acid-binding protein
MATGGIGLIDLHLLASCKLGKVKLLTKDKRLSNAATQLDLLAP